MPRQEALLELQQALLWGFKLVCGEIHLAIPRMNESASNSTCLRKI